MKKFSKSLLIWAGIIILVLMLFKLFQQPQGDRFSEFKEEARSARLTNIPYSDFKKAVNNKQVDLCIIKDTVIIGKYYAENGTKVLFKTVRVGDMKLVEQLEENKILYQGELDKNWWQTVIYFLGPMLLILLFWVFILRQMQSGGKQAMTFGRSKAKLHLKEKGHITFNDVAGVDEAKEELQEIIEFLKDPKKFQRLGGKIPKGVLLFGAPGTGKTLLAKAVAGEAGVPFFSISGSDFVEMFVGVGAARVRDLFEQGRKNAPCILFIDEIDAVGRQRFAGVGGGHDEREQTLNQLLVEMDGFDTREGVILVAATNRPDVLDKALLRSGRFDRQIAVPVPDLRGREGILKVHIKKIKLSPEVEMSVVARRTPGFVGSDLANLINEAALLGARKDKKAVQMPEIEEAIDRVLTGPERKSRIISEKEKKIVSYHEAGHTLVAKLIPGTDPIHKVSIIPRGISALGYTLQLPLEDRYLTTKTEILDRLTVMLGGRVSEEIIFNELTTGDQNDLERVSEITRRMICEYGMSEKLGPLTFEKKDSQVFLGRDITRDKRYSEKTAEEIDQEVKDIIHSCYARAHKLLRANKEKLVLLANALIEKEVLEGDEVDNILNNKVKQDGDVENEQKAKKNKQDKDTESS